MLIPIRKIILLLFIPVSSFDRCNAVAVSEQNGVQKPANHPKKRSSTAKPPASKRKKASSSTNFVEPSGPAQKVSEQTSDYVTDSNQMQEQETPMEPISNSSIGAEHQDLTKDLSAKPVEKEKKGILQRLRDRFSRKKE